MTDIKVPNIASLVRAMAKKGKAGFIQGNGTRIIKNVKQKNHIRFVSYV